MVNYVKLGTLSLFKVTYAYFDTSDYLLDQILVNKKIQAKFGKEFKKRDKDLIVIQITVSKKDESRLIEAFGELWNKMMVMGYKDYEKDVADAMEKLNQ